MSDAAIFVLVFGGLLVLRIIAATVVFLLILPRGDRCPLCDSVTVRLDARLLRRSRLRLAKRWCLVCGWDGYMRVLPPSSVRTTRPNDAVPGKRPTVGPPSRTG